MGAGQLRRILTGLRLRLLRIRIIKTSRQRGTDAFIIGPDAPVIRGSRLSPARLHPPPSAGDTHAAAQTAPPRRPSSLQSGLQKAADPDPGERTYL